MQTRALPLVGVLPCANMPNGSPHWTPKLTCIRARLRRPTRACACHLLAKRTSPSCALGVRIWRLNRVASVGLPCLDRTDTASFVQSQALPRNVRWLCWLEQALVTMLRI
jgi:hypothetical protein